MKPQFLAMALASLGVMAVPETDVPECQEEHIRPWKGDVFTYERPTDQQCYSVTITFPDGDPNEPLRTNISGNAGRCAKPEQIITLPSDISGLMRLNWQCAGRLPSPCRIITVQDEARPGASSDAAASFAVQQSCPGATTAASSIPTVGGASTGVPSSSQPSSAASPPASSASPPAPSAASTSVTTTSNISAQPKSASPSGCTCNHS